MIIKLQLRLVVPVTLTILTSVISGCSGGSNSATDENPYSNGFRLITKTVDNTFDNLDYRHDFDYDTESGLITVTETSFDDGVEIQRTHMLTVDAAGRLLNEQFTPGSIVSDEDFKYDSLGRLSGTTNGHGSKQYNYANGSLQEILYTRHDRLLVDVKAVFFYDENSQLVRVDNLFEGWTTVYESNSLGQLITSSQTATVTGQPLLSTSWEYDENGNLVKESITRKFGEMWQVSEYQYGPSDSKIYNQQLMRLRLQPFYALVHNFLDK